MNGSSRAPNLRAGPAHALGDRADPAVLAGQQRDDAVGLAQLLGAQDDRLVAVEGHGCHCPTWKRQRRYAGPGQARATPDTASATGVSPSVSSRTWCTVPGACSSSARTAADVVAAHGALGDGRPQAHPPGAGVVGQRARPQDGPVQVAGGEVDVGVALDPQVVLEGVGQVPSAAGVHEHRHHDEPAHPRRGGRVDQLDGALAVDRVRGLGASAPTRAGAEDDRVGPLQRLRQLLGRGRDQVEHQRLDPGRIEVGRLPGGADQPDRLVPPRGEQRTEPQPDLAMTSGDDGSHALHRAASNARSKNGVRWSP